MFTQQMAPDIFVRILRGMGACRKKPAQPASGTLSWMTPSETLLRLCLGGFGKIFAKQRLLLAFVRFHGPIFETENPSKTCALQGASPVRGEESTTGEDAYMFVGTMMLQEEDTRAGLQASDHDDVRRDTNHAVAHLS